VTQSTTNYVQNINVNDVNDTDVWLYGLDDFGQIQNTWTQVPDIVGNNTIYNSLSKNVRNIYNVVTKNNDAIDLVFGDGNFSNIPAGSFRVYHRVSDNAKYAIQPNDMQGIQFNIPYVDINGGAQILTVTASLKQSVYNAAATESNASIQEKAPQTYYSQNRMITAEDYNVVPLSASQEIVKIKYCKQNSIRHSRAKDIVDPTGAYSNVSVYADDGIIYREEISTYIHIYVLNKNDILNTINSSGRIKIKRIILKTILLFKNMAQKIYQLCQRAGSVLPQAPTPTQVISQQAVL